MTAYRKNAGAVFSLKYHVVWCPKYRRAVLVGAVAERLEALLREKIADEGLTVHALEVMPESRAIGCIPRMWRARQQQC